MPSVVLFLEKNAERYPELPAVSDTRQTLSYRELWQKAQCVAAQLLAHGFSKGANILVEADADVSFAVSAMGIQLAGCVLVPVERNAPLALFLRLAGEMQPVLAIGRGKKDGISCITPADLLKSAELRSGKDRQWEFPQENDPAEILYTTGTTGRSKSVILSHRAVFASSDNNLYMDRLNPASVYLIASPLNHINALRKLWSCFLCGAHAVLLDGFLDLKRFYGAVEQYHVNTLVLPPAAVRFLLLVSQDKLHSLSGQIKVVHTNSAPMTEMDKETMRQCLPASRLIFGYGATEAGSVCCAYNYAELPGMENCTGRPTPHAKIIIVDDQRREIRSSREHPGYLAVSGDTVMEGYWNDPVRTAEVLLGNTLYTHDLGYKDENGFIYVIGREGDIINCGGLKVAPAEVENIVMHYPGIRDCVCFGAEDAIAGTAVKLNIVAEDAEHFDMQSFRRFLQTCLESGKMPKDIRIADAIPRTQNGKIDRKRLGQES